MKVGITGGSGFVGKKLAELLLENGHEVYILTRGHAKKENGMTFVKWLGEDDAPEKELDSIDAWVNLAGKSINDGRWSETHKKEVVDSRMLATEELIRIIKAVSYKPTVLVNASAIGIYPASTTASYTETSTEKATDFLGETVQKWEGVANRAEEAGVRTVLARFGVILGDEGALPLMTLPYKLFVGGTVGSGRQWVSWVHVDDVARAILYAIITSSLNGPINVTAPNPLRMKDFGRAIGEVLRRPHFLSVPSFMMKLLLGEKSTIVLEGQNVLPQALLGSGFNYKYPKAEEALKDIMGI